MRVVIPFDATDPKTRLGPTLSPAERDAFAHAMAREVIETVRAAGGDPHVVATEATALDAPSTVDDRPLNAVVDDAIAAETPVAVVMADLAIATPAAVEDLFETPGDVVLAPGRGGGTNAMVVRDPAFHVDYHGASIRDHRRVAREAGLALSEVDSFRLATDVDEPDDLVEVLLHGDGAPADWLREAGFQVQITDGRPTAGRA